VATRQQLQRWKARGTTTQRGLGASHQNLREHLLPSAYGTLCPGPYIGRRSANCTGTMVDRSKMDLDDRVPRIYGGRSTTTGGRICCSPCNRGAGATLGNRRRARSRPKLVLPTW
jgi:5-methylcytosine-specific restriction endonuclease McrA